MTSSSGSLPFPPGRFGLPLIGETGSFLQDQNFASKRHELYGDIFKTNLFGRPTVYLSGDEAVRFVLLNEDQYFVVTWPPSTSALLGSASLAVQIGEIHVQRRKLLAQAFQPRALSSYIPTMVEMTQSYCDRWVQQGTFTWYPELRDYTLDIACKLIIGIDNGSKTSFGHWFEAWTGGLFSVPLPLPWTQFWKALRSRQLLLQEVERIVKQRQAQPDSGQDTLGLLIQARDEDGQGLNVEELQDQILTLLFAGHETLTSAIATFCLKVTQHPTILSKLCAEQSQFHPDQPLTLESLKQMEYLEQVLKEVLRILPPVGGGFRQVIQTCEIGGYTIPKGWVVLYEISQTHQNPVLYPDPKQFDPDRFAISTTTEKAKPFSYVPFGGGIRECLGKEFARLEMKIFAALLLRNYEWTLLPDQNFDFITVPTPRPKDGLKVEFYHLRR